MMVLIVVTTKPSIRAAAMITPNHSEAVVTFSKATKVKVITAMNGIALLIIDIG
jgi:hypothetical protein